MPKIIKNVTDMEIDEISLVDRGANQHALVTIAKRAETEEDPMPEIDLYDDEGSPIEGDLEDGQIVFDEEGNAYRWELDDEAEEADERELETVGKSNPFDRRNIKTPVGKSFAESVLEELSKADTDEGRDEVLSKAFGRMEELEKSFAEATEIAKRERETRLIREYVAKADTYNLPVDPDELGPVLYRMVETMSDEDCRVIAKCLDSASSLVFDEIGVLGSGDNADVMSKVNAFATEEIGKADAGAIESVFDANPDAYNEYLAQRG